MQMDLASKVLSYSGIFFVLLDIVDIKEGVLFIKLINVARKGCSLLFSSQIPASCANKFYMRCISFALSENLACKIRTTETDRLE